MAGTRPKLAVRTPEGFWTGGLGIGIIIKLEVVTLASVRAGGGRRLPTPQDSHHACASTASLLLARGVPPECISSSVLYMFCISFVLFCVC